MYLLISAVVLLLCSVPPAESGSGRERQVAIERVLLKGAQTKMSRPGGDGPVVVNVSYTLTYIAGLDPDKMQFHTVGYLKLYWKDERLAFRSDQIHSVRVDAGQIWTPDIELYNAAAPMEMLNRQNLAVVYSTGEVNWIPNVGLRSFCQTDPEAEEHICFLNFGSWTFNGLDMDLVAPEYASLADYVGLHPRLGLKNTTAEKRVQYYQCCPEPYVNVRFTYHMTGRL